MLAVQSKAVSGYSSIINAAVVSHDNVLSQITQSDAISLWALSSEHQDWLRETHFSGNELPDLRNIYELSTKTLERSYKDKEIPLDKMLNRKSHWKDFQAWIDRDYLKKRNNSLHLLFLI